MNTTNSLLRRCVLAITGTTLALVFVVGVSKGSEALTSLLSAADMTGGAVVHVHFPTVEGNLPRIEQTAFGSALQ
ncbi:MAG: hypothetical protein U5K56_13905 [Halioglobus sp.]|nr:hypothetical protein [Halioglobus sp.]